MKSAINDELVAAGFDQISLTDVSAPEAVTSDSLDTSDTSSGDDGPNFIIFIAIGAGVVLILACVAVYMTMNSSAKVVQSGPVMMELQEPEASPAKRKPESDAYNRGTYDEVQNYGGTVPPDDGEVYATPGHTGIDVEQEGDAILTRY